MIVRPITFAAALDVALRMRRDDAAEIFATRADDDREALARTVLDRGPFAWAAGLDGEPVACIGAAEAWPGMFEAWMFATDNFHRIGFSLTRFVRRGIMPLVAAAGANRVQAHSADTHVAAHAWLESLGAMHEATLSRFGRNGEAFRVYAWTRA